MTPYFSIVILASCYAVMFVFTGITNYNSSNRIFDSNGIPAKSMTQLIGLLIAGIFFFAFLPLLVFNQTLNSLLRNSAAITRLMMLFFIFLVVLAVITGCRAGNKIMIAWDGNHGLSHRFFIGYFIVRIAFICSYELFFRGILLFGCMNRFGTTSAIAGSTLLTVLLHVFTNKKEMTGCIPFGILLSICCMYFQSVWPAMIIHIVLCLSYEMTGLNFSFTRLKPTA